MRRWAPRTLAGTFLVLQLAVVALVLLVAAIVSVRQAQAQFRGYAAERILGAAESLATNPLVRERLPEPTATTDLAPVAESVRIQSGASTVLLPGWTGGSSRPATRRWSAPRSRCPTTRCGRGGPGAATRYWPASS